MEETRPISLRIGAGAHRGLVREENQDRISRLLSPFGDVFVVADGMGGHEGGATAAQLLIDRLGEHLRAQPPGMPPDEALRDAAVRTNVDICEHARADPRLAKMGATVVLALIQGSRAWIAHAGDSRAYLWRDGELARLTRDHTLVQRMVDHQILNEEEARQHPDANVVTRAFGQNPEIEIEVTPLELADGDRLLLCSDGLSGYVDDTAIARALSGDGDAQALADSLIALALQAGGEDNVSVQLLAVHDEPTQAAAPPRRKLSAPPPPVEPLPVEKTPAEERRRGLSGFLLVLPLILVAGLAGILLPWRDWLAPAPPEPAAPEATMPEQPATSDLTEPTDPYAGPLAEPPPGSTPPPPRVTVVSPAGAEAPEVRQRVLRAYPGNWSTPEPLDDRLAGALEEGRVYFRSGFGPAAASLARELGYPAAPWPEGLARDHLEADLLVLYPGRPVPGDAP